MADIDIRRTHALGLSAARAAAERMEAELKRKFDLRGDWKGDTLHFERPGVNGTLAVSDQDVHLSVALGFLLKAMKGSIQASVEQELDKLFASARAKPAAAPKPASAKPKKPGPAPKK
jgi:putative polyhydroxyalkanoate system protein